MSYTTLKYFQRQERKISVPRRRETEEYAEYCSGQPDGNLLTPTENSVFSRKVSEYAVPIVTETERVEEIWKAEGKRNADSGNYIWNICCGLSGYCSKNRD